MPWSTICELQIPLSVIDTAVEKSEGRTIPSLVIADDYGIHTRRVGSEIKLAYFQVVDQNLNNMGKMNRLSYDDFKTISSCMYHIQKTSIIDLQQSPWPSGTRLPRRRMLRICMVLTISNLIWCHQSFVYRHESRSNWHRGHSQYQPFNIRQAFLFTTRHIFNNVMHEDSSIIRKSLRA